MWELHAVWGVDGDDSTFHSVLRFETREEALGAKEESQIDETVASLIQLEYAGKEEEWWPDSNLVQLYSTFVAPAGCVEF